ncbi:hypothetical protein HWV62_42992 [Athelia sp. TMB]|nr:hypothetical protein HWV62_42992 [Athelia sp. TMB]
MSTSAVARTLHPSQYKPTRLALDIVKNIIAKKGSVDNQSLYALTQKVQLTPAQLKENALEQQALAPGRPGMAEPIHPVRSMSFLKRSIMPALVELNEVEKVHAKQKIRAATSGSLPDSADSKPGKVEVSTWTWQLKQLKAPKHKEIFQPASIEAALGKGANWGHLNRRRRGRREEKIELNLRWAKDLDKIRRQVATEKSEDAYRLQLQKQAESTQARLAQAAAAPAVTAEVGEQPSAP